MPDFSHEAALRRRGALWVAGVDEVGRGPLAGPVAVAAVILDPKAIPDGIDDSKCLPEARREALSRAILESAVGVSVALASAAEIDLYNIRGATLRAMRRALAALTPRPHYALIDGRDTPADLICPALALVGGDGRSQSIAAASIVAKVLRDGLMREADRHCPGYGFAAHKGYGTAAHRAPLERLGLSRLHRRSFRCATLVFAD